MIRWDPSPKGSSLNERALFSRSGDQDAILISANSRFQALASAIFHDGSVDLISSVSCLPKERGELLVIGTDHIDMSQGFEAVLELCASAKIRYRFPEKQWTTIVTNFSSPTSQNVGHEINTACWRADEMK